MNNDDVITHHLVATLLTVTWHCLYVLAVVIEGMGGWKGGVAIGDGNNEAMVMVN